MNIMMSKCTFELSSKMRVEVTLDGRRHEAYVTSKRKLTEEERQEIMRRIGLPSGQWSILEGKN